MKTLVLLFAWCIIPAGPLAQETALEGTPEELLIAIEAFGADPDSELGEKSMFAIARFVNNPKSPGKIIFNANVQPWLAADPSVEHVQPLMLAYVAGNFRSQIETGVFRDDTYSGLLFVIRVYNHLQAADHEFSVPQIDEMIELHRQGKLRQYIAEKKSVSDSVKANESNSEKVDD